MSPVVNHSVHAQIALGGDLRGRFTSTKGFELFRALVGSVWVYLFVSRVPSRRLLSLSRA